MHPRSAACLLLLACTLPAQTPPRPAFEVASIKPTAPPAGPGAFHPNRGGPGTSDPTRIAWTSTLPYLVQQAYGMQLDQVLGMDGKMFYPTETFEINATMHPGTTQEEFRLMLQNLLAERFHLAVHHEAKPFPGYELTVANGGPKLKESTPVEPVPATDKPALAVNVPDETGFPRLRPGASTAMITPGLGKWGMYRGRFRESMAQFAAGLPGMINGSNGEQMGADAPRVADRTGLTGTYEFTLEFAGGVMIPQTSLLGQLRRAQNPDAPASEPAGSGGGPTLFNALEKQLGLQLKKTKDVPVDILVVDHADKTPTGD